MPYRPLQPAAPAQRAKDVERPKPTAWQRDWARKLIQRGRYTILAIGLDDVPGIASTRGVDHAEMMLRQLRARLERLLPSGALLAEEPSEIFVALPGYDIESGLRLAERARKVLRQPVRVDSQLLHTSISVGSCAFPEDADRFETALRRASSALSRAQRAGGNRIEHFDRDVARTLQRSWDLTAGLWRAYEQSLFSMVFQPIIDAKTGRVCGAESLLRWFDPELGPVRPSEFVPQLERSGLIVGVGEWMLRNACARFGELHAQGHEDLVLNVNVSPRQFEENGFVERVRTALAAQSFPPDKLVLEVTENLLLVEPHETARRMQQLRNLGVGLVLDDFGTGHASVGYLQQLPVCGLKIDRAFIAGLPGDQKVARMTRALVGLGKALQLAMTAEGIETAAQADMLIKLGVDRLQGFHFSRGLHYADFRKHLESEKQRN